MLAIEAVLALNHAGMHRPAQCLSRPDQALRHDEIRHGGELDWRVLQAGVLIPDGTGGHHKIAGTNIDGDAAAGTGADKSVGAAMV